MNGNDRLLIYLIYLVSLATLALIIGLGVFMYLTNTELNNVKGSIQTLKTQVKSTPAKGEPGYTPIKGIDYSDGKDSVSKDTTVVKQQPIKGDPGYTPIKGVDYFDGKKGENGLSPEIFVDPESCILMTRYPGDGDWNIQAQLPKPCEVL